MKTKRILLLAILFFFCSIYYWGCKKEEPVYPTYKIEQNLSDLKLENQILDFKKDLNSNLKSSKIMCVDDALWLIEAVFNYRYSFAGQQFGTTESYVNEIEFDLKDDHIFFSKVKKIIREVNDVVYKNFESNVFENKHVVSIGIESNDTCIVVNTVIGEFKDNASKKSWTPFNSTSYWYAGLGNGKCDDYAGQFIGRDATTEIERLAHYYFPAHHNKYYYTNITKVENRMYYYYYANGSEPYDDYCDFYLFFRHTAPGNCLDPNEMNFYMNGFETIMNQHKPSGKYFVTVDYVYESQPPSLRWHKIKLLQYGTRNLRGSGDPVDPKPGFN